MHPEQHSSDPEHHTGHAQPHSQHHQPVVYHEQHHAQTPHHTRRRIHHHKAVRLSGKTVFAGGLFLGWFFALSLLILAIVWLVFIQLGLNPGSPEITKAQSAQMAFWTTIWSLLAMYLIYRALRHRRKIFGRYSRRLLLLAMPAGLVIGSFTTAGFSIAAYHTPASPEICDIQSTLKTALSSTIAINTEEGRGSGFIVDGSGLVVTNYHVIESGGPIYTWKDENTRVPMTIVRTSPQYDLALLRIDEQSPSYLEFATIDDDHPAESVFAVGFPGNTFSEGYATVSSGIVSRKLTPSSTHNLPSDIELFQTDAAINPGNSGGPIINKCGVIGVTMSISTATSDFSGLPREEGIGYAISSSTVKKILQLQ